MADHTNRRRLPLSADDALNQLRGDVTDILDEGSDPREVLALGKLVTRYVPQDTDLQALHDALEHSTLSEVVGDVAFALGAGVDEDEDEDDPLGEH